MAKAMRTNDAEALQASYQASYDVYAREIVDRRMLIPDKAVAETIEQVRQSGGSVRRKPEELYANAFTVQLEKSGFLKEFWGSEWPAAGR